VGREDAAERSAEMVLKAFKAKSETARKAYLTAAWLFAKAR
jgi:hypothetical protein